MTMYSDRIDPLAALREHEARVRAAQRAVADLTKFAQYQAAITLRAMQLAASAGDQISPDEVLVMYEETTREYFARLAREIDKVAGELAASLGESEPPAHEIPTFRFFQH